MTDLDLSRFSVDGEAVKKTSKGWSLKPIESHFTGRILAFDQSLSATGWVMLDCAGGRLTIQAVGMITTGSSNKGTLGSLERADEIGDKAERIIESAVPDMIAHETPPSGGGRLMRPEASLMAAVAIRRAAARFMVQHISMQHAQSGKARFTGQRGADKKDVHAVLRSMLPEIEGFKPNNDNTRDALIVGVLAAEKGI